MVWLQRMRLGQRVDAGTGRGRVDLSLRKAALPVNIMRSVGRCSKRGQTLVSVIRGFRKQKGV